eukprot:298191-Hanusia_phi.AAC.1
MADSRHLIDRDVSYRSSRGRNGALEFPRPHLSSCQTLLRLHPDVTLQQVAQLQFSTASSDESLLLSAIALSVGAGATLFLPNLTKVRLIDV